MDVRALTHAERPELDDQWDDVVRPAWPEFMLHDATVNELWHHLFEEHPAFQLYLVDPREDLVVGVGNTLPFRWDASPDDLPDDGLDGILRRGIQERRRGVEPNALCAMQAVVRPGVQGQGLSSRIVREMAALAARNGFRGFVAPVRPNEKHRHPRVPIEEYITWRREDGLLADAWLRVHERTGATVLKICPESMYIHGTVAEWSEWTGMEFPASGEFLVPGALVPVTIDVERDLGEYVEPNVWMTHPLPVPGA